MNDFHAFDNAILARVTRQVRKLAIIPLIALLGGCSSEPVDTNSTSYKAGAAIGGLIGDVLLGSDRHIIAATKQNIANGCQGWQDAEMALLELDYSKDSATASRMDSMGGYETNGYGRLAYRETNYQGMANARYSDKKADLITANLQRWNAGCAQ